jgi:hypothetical protein
MMADTTKPRPRRRRPIVRESNFDLTSGGFRLDLKTGLLLLAFLFQWWDGRARADVASSR